MSMSKSVQTQHTMAIEMIEQDFHSKVCAQIRLEPEGVERYRVFTPFRFDDGDHLAIALRREAGQWILSDEGHTYMHLTYDLDEKSLHRGTRQQIIANALSAFAVEDREGELMLTVRDERYGDTLFDFIQALLKITDVTYLSRERVKSARFSDVCDKQFSSLTANEDRIARYLQEALREDLS